MFFWIVENDELLLAWDSRKWDHTTKLRLVIKGFYWSARVLVRPLLCPVSGECNYSVPSGFIPGCSCSCPASAKDPWVTVVCLRASWTSWTVCCVHCSSHKLQPSAGLKVKSASKCVACRPPQIRDVFGAEITSRKWVWVCFPGVLDIPMISWVVMLVSRLLDCVASIEDEAAGGKKHLGGKERERSFTGTWTVLWNYSSPFVLNPQFTLFIPLYDFHVSSGLDYVIYKWSLFIF